MNQIAQWVVENEMRGILLTIKYARYVLTHSLRISHSIQSPLKL